MVCLRIRSFVMQSGERFALIVEKSTGVPVYAANLFLTTQVRNCGRSSSSVKAYAGHLVALLGFFSSHCIDIAVRIRDGRFLSDFELQAMQDYLGQQLPKDSTDGDAIVGRRKKGAAAPEVSKKTQKIRLLVAAKYLEWLARQELDHSRVLPAGVKEMVGAIRCRCPRGKDRNTGLVDRSLSPEEESTLLKLVGVTSPLNPFSESVRHRNRLMILVEYELGIRGGELLNIRIGDFNFATNHLDIIRRADQADDPRTEQPLVKTRDRRLVLSDWMMKEIHNFILYERKKVPHAKKSAYLFVTHKAGPTQGQPLSIAAYKKMWAKIHDASPTLRAVTGHSLRHHWNYKFSQFVDNTSPPISEAREQAMRSQQQGWKPGSGVAARYNRRSIIAKANEVSLRLQEKSRARIDHHE